MHPFTYFNSKATRKKITTTNEGFVDHGDGPTTSLSIRTIVNADQKNRDPGFVLVSGKHLKLIYESGYFFVNYGAFRGLIK